MLEDEVKIDPRYATLFTGLKLNHPHNVAIAHPLAFLLRRVLFAFVIVFMPSQPQIGAVLLLMTCVGMLCFVLTEDYWKDRIITQQHIVNEIAFYFVCISLVLCSGMVAHPIVKISIGWTLIGAISLTMLYNITIMAVCSVKFSKLLIKKALIVKKVGLKKALQID